MFFIYLSFLCCIDRNYALYFQQQLVMLPWTYCVNLPWSPSLIIVVTKPERLRDSRGVLTVAPFWFSLFISVILETTIGKFESKDFFGGRYKIVRQLLGEDCSGK